MRVQRPRAHRCSVTGANGFIGRALLAALPGPGAEVAEWTSPPIRRGTSSRATSRSQAWQAHAAGAELVINTAAGGLEYRATPAGLAHQRNGCAAFLDAAVAAVRRVSCRSVLRHVRQAVPAEPGRDLTLWPGRDRAQLRRYEGRQRARGARGARLGRDRVHDRATGRIVYGPGSRPWVLIPLEAIAQAGAAAGSRSRHPEPGVHRRPGRRHRPRRHGAHRARPHLQLAGGVGVPAPSSSRTTGWAGRTGKPRAWSTVNVERLMRVASLPSRLRRHAQRGRAGGAGVARKPGTFSIGKARRMLATSPVDLAEGVPARTEDWLRATGLR